MNDPVCVIHGFSKPKSTQFYVGDDDRGVDMGDALTVYIRRGTSSRDAVRFLREIADEIEKPRDVEGMIEQCAFERDGGKAQ